MMDYDSLLELVKQRRSIRRFKPEPIPDEYVDKIVEVARWAPSGANTQPWEFIVIKKDELREKIVELITQRNSYTRQVRLFGEGGLSSQGQDNPLPRLGYADAPVYIILCGDTRHKDFYPLAASARAESIFASSLACAFLYMQLVATTLGLASQWVTATADPILQRLIKGFLGIPKELEIYDMLAVGYPAGEPRPRLVRAKEEMIHYEGYDNSRFRSEAQIRQVASSQL